MPDFFVFLTSFTIAIEGKLETVDSLTLGIRTKVFYLNKNKPHEITVHVEADE